VRKYLVGGERQDVGIRSCEVFDCKALVRAAPRYANALVQQFQTMSLWSAFEKDERHPRLWNRRFNSVDLKLFLSGSGALAVCRCQR
jgi:hypothetical protein